MKIARVGDICEQIRGVTYSKGDASDTPRPGYSPILRANNIGDDGLILDELVFVPDGKITLKQRVIPGDVVIAASSGSLSVVGKAAQARGDFDGAFGAFCKVLRPSPDIDPLYFGHYFRTSSYRQTVSRLAAGVNINNLKNEHLDDLEIKIPPINEQRRISRILDSSDALRAKRRKALEELDALLQSALIDMFGDPAENPKGWEYVPLGTLIVSGPTNGIYKPAKEYGDGIRILRIDSFYDGVISDVRSLKRVRISQKEAATYALREDDIVVNRVNSREYLGKCALVPSLEEPMVFESNMMRLSVDAKRIVPQYAVEILKGSFVKKQILKACKDAVNQSSINQGDVRGFVVPLPPLELQQRFVSIAASIQEQKLKQQAHLHELDQLFASLQSRAFKGQL